MTESLVAFARSGNPNTASLKWPRFSTANPMLLEFDTTAHVSPWPDHRKFDFFRAESKWAAARGAVRD